MRPHAIPGTMLFDDEQAQKGLALNRMCFSFNSAENRAAFLQGRGRLLPRNTASRRSSARRCTSATCSS